MSEEKFRVYAGTVQPVIFHKFENGRMVTYHYSIKRDINGIETSRTEPQPLGSVGYDDGSVFAEDDYDFYRYGTPRKKKGFFAWLFNT